MAYLGLAGTRFADHRPLPCPTNYPAGQTPYDQGQPDPGLAHAPAGPGRHPQTYTWKDLGGSNLDTTKATFVMPNNSESTDLGKLQQYIKGPKTSGGLQYPQVKVGQTVYPISECQWASNVYDNFTYMKTRYTSSKASNGKWRVTAAVYSTTNPLAAAPRRQPLAGPGQVAAAWAQRGVCLHVLHLAGDLRDRVSSPSMSPG